MPATIDLRTPVNEAEHAIVKRKAGKRGIAAYIRKLLELPPIRPGRPPKSR